MREFISTYPYFVGSAAYSAVVVVLALTTLRAAQARLTLWSGVLGVPTFIYLGYFERVYWHPRRIGGLSLGFEDALLSFMLAATTWYLAALVFGGSLQVEVRYQTALRRAAILSVVGGLLFLPVAESGVDPMTALLLTYLILTPLLWWQNRWAWRLVAIGIPALALTWLAALRFFFWVHPEAVLVWNPQGPWGTLIAGVPRGELVWAAGYGGLWPLVTAYVYDVRWRPGA